MGSNFLQKFQPFCAHLVVDICEPGKVAAWLCQAGTKAAADGIGNLGKYDRHSPRRLLQCGHGWSARSKDNVWRQCYQFSCSFRIVGITGVPAIVDLQIATIGPTQPLQFLKECGNACLSFWTVFGKRREQADMPNLFALLC